ncbi:MAG: MXAN_6640 family putative metalloprotease [Myxococcota bacterium]
MCASLLPALGFSSDARAEERPTEGGLWSFDADDAVETWDTPEGAVRVHFSVNGPNAVSLVDGDDDGVPDYPQQVAREVVASLDMYIEDLGVRPPLPERRVGPALGGNAALDVYLVDFGGAADGRFGTDDCTDDGRCSGFLVIENDFSGYGYPSVAVGVSVVASHELFHAVQAAYAPIPVWLSEGGATWATHRYDESLPDFVNACAGYLADTGRPIFEPPLGPVPAFAYGSALWWEFATRRHDDSLMDAMLDAIAEAPEGTEAQDVMDDVMADFGDSLFDAWPIFVQYNLASGFRAGGAASHPYAPSLPAIEADLEGTTIDVDARLFPLAAEYWRIDHPGGDLFAGADDALANSVVTLHPVADFASDGVVGEAIAGRDLSEAGSARLYESLPAGGYWLVATQAAVADGSARARVCIGSAEHVEQCGIEPVVDDTGVDTTDGGDDEPSADASSSGSVAESSSVGDTDMTLGGAAGDPDGCACRAGSGGGGGWAWCLLLAALPGSRRRR